ncbi:hypothetical protein OSTOST_00970 [Ostertagia ostertagi]
MRCGAPKAYSSAEPQPLLCDTEHNRQQKRDTHWGMNKLRRDTHASLLRFVKSGPVDFYEDLSGYSESLSVPYYIRDKFVDSPSEKPVRLLPVPKRNGILFMLHAELRTFRLVVVGSARTGKSSLVGRFLDADFEDRYIPTIENFYRKLYKIKSEVYQLDIIDCSGNDPFPAARKLSYISGKAFSSILKLQ